MIKSLLKKLGFHSKKQIETNDQMPNNNSIVFWVGDDGLPYVKVYIVDTKTESAQNFADMLYSLNTGQYINYTLSILLDISRQDSTSNNYIKSVIEYWHQCYPVINTQESDNEPHIKPTAFNSIINNEQ